MDDIKKANAIVSLEPDTAQVPLTPNELDAVFTRRDSIRKMIGVVSNGLNPYSRAEYDKLHPVPSGYRDSYVLWLQNH